MLNPENKYIFQLRPSNRMCCFKISLLQMNLIKKDNQFKKKPEIIEKHSVA